jgi:hypothetical protein
MDARSRTAAILYLVNAGVSLLLGVVYVMRDEFMPYHADALERSWEAVEPPLQTLLSALMQVAGAGWIVLGIATLVLVAIPMRRGEIWARWLVPALLLVFYVPTLLATLAVLNETPATPPWQGNAIACLTTGIGLMLDAPWRRSSRPK